MVARYRLLINPLMILLTLIFLFVFGGLSAWQVNRMYEKQAIAERIEFANNEAAIQLAGAGNEFLLAHLFYRARGKGQFLVDRCFFVENVISNGKPGLYYYCPFQLAANNRLLLVNLGWMKRGGDRLALPAVEVPGQLVEIEGLIKMPRSKPVVTTTDGQPNMEVAELWAYFDFDYLQRQFESSFYPVELQLTSDIAGELQRDWTGYDPKIGMHIGYAIHWAAFALATLVLFLKFNLKKTGDDD